MHPTHRARGFTLIELLIVIAIVAVLAVTVVLTLNPAQLLRQARDTTRTSDLSGIKSALALYLTDAGTPSIGASANCYSHASSSMTLCSSRFSGGTVVTSTAVAVTGTGWIPVNFSAISAGSPFSTIPRDPVNNATYYYAYKVDATNLTFELNADMESTKYSSGGGADVETNDGGNNPAFFEIGSAPGLAL